jgi:hypothetical protein
VHYTHFLKKVDHADELGCLDKVECSLARQFFLLRSSNFFFFYFGAAKFLNWLTDWDM